MSEPEFNYSIGVLIVLLMSFWFVCKCMRPKTDNTCKRKHNHYEGMEMGYDSIPVIVDDSYGLSYIRNKDGKIVVPNSKHNIRDHYSDHENRCSSTEYSEIQTTKKKTETYSAANAGKGVKAVPSGATSSRALIERSD
jgi:hypothetical protein